CRRKEATTLFRVMFWLLPYPFLPVYHLMYSPHHSPIGLFRLLNWATSPRSGWRCAQLRAGPASGALAGRAEVRVPPVTESHIDPARPQAGRWTHTPRTMSRISAPALRTWAQRWMRQAHALDSP